LIPYIIILVGNHDYHKLVLCGTGTRIPEYGVKEGRKGTRKKEKRKKEKKKPRF
jgi:hypothetical protein